MSQNIRTPEQELLGRRHLLHSAGHRLNLTFCLSFRHCKAKAEMTHTLIHWRYHLNEWVTGYLERKGFFEDSKIVERSQWSQKKKTKYANEVVDIMDEAGEVQKLWRDFHLSLRAARESKVGIIDNGDKSNNTDGIL